MSIWSVVLVAVPAIMGATTPEDEPAKGQGAPPRAVGSQDWKADPAWKPLGQSLWFDPASRRLIVQCRLVLREGPLEHLLCLKGTKEHEAILATDAKPRLIHAGLLLMGAEAGQPVKFDPMFTPPKGSSIAIELEWREAAQTRKATGRSWVRDQKGQPPSTDWVFAGSQLVDDPVTGEKFYAADDGDLITVANFPSSILDLPFASSDSDAGRTFEANTPVLPTVGTTVRMWLSPIPKKP